jgi:H+/Cl- antiporter ClcA/CBS domain-containing protein
MKAVEDLRTQPSVQLRAPREPALIDARVALISGLCILLGLATAVVAKGLIALIGFVTQLAFYGRISWSPISPAGHTLGAWVIAIPVIGGVVVGLMARYGSRGICGHGIPEAMERVLLDRSRIPFRLAWLKPLSAAISIGTGGPFGAEGPIIATGGAIGSALGQILTVTAHERKTLLAAGAAAGMSATFGSPVSAVLLAIELLLFEYRPRSLIPVALASATAAAGRIALFGAGPAFRIPELASSLGSALPGYLAIGAIAGLASVIVTRLVYSAEDHFEKLPIHWMWWPALGGIAVGLIGWFAPRTLGVGYDNIEALVSGNIMGTALAVLCVAKFVSWAIALGSGTSGGTLAPLLTIGAGLGAGLGVLADHAWPSLGIDPRMAALVGMAALFAGASRALLASAVFAFEATQQPTGLLPLLGGCGISYLVSAMLMRHSIMTEKIARRGTRVLADYAADFLDQVLVAEVASQPAVTLAADDTVEAVRAWLASPDVAASHQGFPVVNAAGALVGVVMRREIVEPAAAPGTRVQQLIKRPPAVVYEDNSLREAADHMVHEGVGRLPVVTRADPTRVVALLTRSDLLEAHERRVDEAHRPEAGIVLPVRGARKTA